MKNSVFDGIFGAIVGDVLGVPYEFLSPEEVQSLEAQEWIIMKSGGAWGQPSWTWSDDSSLTLCLTEALLENFSLRNIAEKFVQWKMNDEKSWNAGNKLFDIWRQTSSAIDLLAQILEQNDDECLEFLPYESDFFQNGNGSLMRILPMLWYVRGHDIVWKFQKIYQVSALTHPHILSALACFFYIQIAENILEEKDKKQAIYDAQKDLEKIVQTQEIDEKTEKEIEKWLSRNLLDIETDSIESSGFVGDSLILAVQIFFHSENFEDALKNCIRKGGDTDTLGTICGGLLWLYYGYKNIPHEWIGAIRKKDEIVALLEEFSQKYL